MSVRLIFFCALVFLSQQQVSSQLINDFFYNGFQDATKITLDGAAQIQKNGILRLTDDTFRFQGHAFYPAPIKFKDSRSGEALSFSTCFAFAIIPEYPKLGGHGFAFAISRSRSIPAALPSQYLGLLNSDKTKNANNYVLAVEFDTVKDFEFSDINDNHIGIDMDSLISNDSVSAAPINLTSGERILAWVDYYSAKNRLDVTISLSNVKPNRSILSFDVNLSPILSEYMYVGFSASTGLLASSHYIFGWSFNATGGEARDLDLSLLPSLPEPKKSYKTLITVVAVTTLFLVVASIGISGCLIRKIRNADVVEPWELNIGPHRFSYEALKRATRGFRDKELLGFGGFGRVYRGTLPKSKTLVAVKRISHESRQGLREFLSEIASIGRLRHRNLVQLLGWCRRRGDLLLVYEYMPNGSLDTYLFHDDSKSAILLNWDQRFKIIKDVALGLLYLHEEWEQTVIHRDIKAGNVLLDMDLNGRLGDFGLAKLYEHGSNPSTTRVVGTLGYLAPELTRSGQPTTSSDVFAFGALVLEVVCGRRPIEPKSSPEEMVLVDWVWEKWRFGAILEAVDAKLMGDYSEYEVVVALKLGLMCSDERPASRPTMRQVVRYLEGEIRLPTELTPTPGLIDGGRVEGEFEDFMLSYPSTLFGKVTHSSAGDDMEVASPIYSTGGT